MQGMQRQLSTGNTGACKYKFIRSYLQRKADIDGDTTCTSWQPPNKDAKLVNTHTSADERTGSLVNIVPAKSATLTLFQQFGVNRVVTKVRLSQACVQLLTPPVIRQPVIQHIKGKLDYIPLQLPCGDCATDPSFRTSACGGDEQEATLFHFPRKQVQIGLHECM